MKALEQRKSKEMEERDKYLEDKMQKLQKRRKPSNASSQTRIEDFRKTPPKIGEKVRVKDNGMVGEVARVSNKAVTLIIGNITSKMPLDHVERISSNEYKAAAKASYKPVYRQFDTSIQERKLNFKTELDVRGHRLQDALDIVTHYIDDAIMLGMSSVRIIHGKGTGVLRDEIQKYLRTVPGVASAKDEAIQFGGTGVTVVTFD